MKTIDKDLIEKYRYINVDYPEWCEHIITDWKEKLETLGFMDANIQFTGFCSQGDGASFTCDVSVSKYVDAHPSEAEYRVYEPFFEELDVSIVRRNSHYCHEETVVSSVCDNNINPYSGFSLSPFDEADEQEDIRALVWDAAYEEFLPRIDDLEKSIIETARSYMKEIYRELNNEFDNLISDEAVLEALAAQELAA